MSQKWVKSIWSQFVAILSGKRNSYLIYEDSHNQSSVLIKRVKNHIANSTFMQAWHSLKHQISLILVLVVLKKQPQTVQKFLISNIFIGVYHGFHNRHILKRRFSKLSIVIGCMPYFSKGAPFITLNLFSQIMVQTRWQVISENQNYFCTEKLP